MKTLRQRLVVTALCWLALVLATFGVTVLLLVRQSVQDDLDQYLRDKAVIFGYQVNPWYPAGVFYDEKPWRSDRYTTYGQTFDTNWNLIIKSTRLAEPIPVTDEVKRLAAHPLGSVVHDAVGSDGTHYRMATIRMERQKKTAFYVQVGVKTGDLEAPLRQVRIALVLCVALALVLAGLGLDYVFRQWAAPLSALCEAARSMSSSDISRQRLFAPSGSPELAQLASSFNGLLDRVESSQASQHQFVADASHELRTPLAALRAEIEVCLRRDRSPADYQKALTASRHELDRLAALVENLLALARLDSPPTQNQRGRVNLAVCCRDVVEQLTPLAGAQGVHLRLEVPDDLPVHGDALSLERAVRNLVENAVRHTPAGEEIVVSATAENGQARVAVIDHGVGIAPEHLPRLFDRFYRVDTARTRAIGGAGLGLSIVKAIAEAHDGTISVESKLGHGSTFTLCLPATA